MNVFCDRKGGHGLVFETGEKASNKEVPASKWSALCLFFVSVTELWREIVPEFYGKSEVFLGLELFRGTPAWGIDGPLTSARGAFVVVEVYLTFELVDDGLLGHCGKFSHNAFKVVYGVWSSSRT